MTSMQKSKSIHMVMLLCVISVLGSCNNDKELALSMKEFYSRRIVVPYSEKDRTFCSFYSDTILSGKKWHYFTVIDGSDCQSCEIGKMGTTEKENIERIPQLEFAYIVNASKDDYQYVYRKLCNARIEGTVYIDTCEAFYRANPKFPESKLFRSFVIDDGGKVLFVGNPFKNEKMEALFLKILDREKQRKKAV